MGLLLAWSVLGCAIWCAGFARMMLEASSLRLLAEEAPPEPAVWPRLSVVIAACNEAGTLEQALATLLGQDYPDLEIVLVDDRSTDGTSELIDRMAARDARVRPVHVTSLPEGWLGKVHALHAGVGAARGDWVLFTDADVHFHTGALRKAVALCIADEVDHLVVLPDARARTFLEEAAVDAMGEIFMQRTRAGRIGASNQAYAGVGAFNLVRRATFERSEGFAFLRLEVLDDVGLGLVMRRVGGRARFAIGTGEVVLRWYSSLRDMAGGLEKNLFGWIAHYSAVRLVGTVIAWWAVLAAPVVAVVVAVLAPAPYLWPLAGACGLSLLAAAVVLARRTRRPLGPLLFLPLGRFLVSLMLIRSAIACWRRRGIVWRGTTYPLPALRKWQRVKQ